MLANQNPHPDFLRGILDELTHRSTRGARKFAEELSAHLKGNTFDFGESRNQQLLGNFELIPVATLMETK